MEVSVHKICGVDLDPIKEYVRCLLGGRPFIVETTLPDDTPVTLSTCNDTVDIKDTVIRDILKHCISFNNVKFSKDYSWKAYKDRYGKMKMDKILMLAESVASFLAYIDSLDNAVIADEFRASKWYCLTMECYAKKILDYTKISDKDINSLWLEEEMHNYLITERLKEYSLAKAVFSLVGAFDKDGIPGFKASDKCANNHQQLVMPWEPIEDITKSLLSLVEDN
jgi:hypothetical protein